MRTIKRASSLRTDLTGNDHLTTHARHLNAQVDRATIAHGRGVMSAPMNLAFETLAELGGDLVGPGVACCDGIHTTALLVRAKACIV